MTQEEILKYNKRCALFLGAIDNTHEWGFMLQPNELNLSFDLFDKKLFSNDRGSGWFVKDLKFHSDWNWIMEVVKKIITTHISNENTIIRDYVRESIHYKNAIKESLINVNKEAVVQAINQFLIWYNEQRT